MILSSFQLLPVAPPAQGEAGADHVQGDGGDPAVRLGVEAEGGGEDGLDRGPTPLGGVCVCVCVCVCVYVCTYMFVKPHSTAYPLV